MSYVVETMTNLAAQTGFAFLKPGNFIMILVPSADAVGIVQQTERDVPFVQPFGDAFQVVLEPVRHKEMCIRDSC